MSLNLKSLSQSISSLKRSINSAENKNANFDDDLKETIRAGVIQNFEVAYEQCWKMMQRWIKLNKSPEMIETLRTRKDLFRLAAQFNLIANPQPWFEYGEARNLTAHTYDEKKAISVYDIAKKFLSDSEFFLKQLETMND